jgi:hypothetical protein
MVMLHPSEPAQGQGTRHGQNKSSIVVLVKKGMQIQLLMNTRRKHLCSFTINKMGVD